MSKSKTVAASQRRVMNETQEQIRSLGLQLRDLETNLERKESEVAQLLAQKRNAQAARTAQEVVRMRRERDSLFSQKEKLSECQSGFRQFVGQLETQQRVSEINKEQSKMFESVDVVGLMGAGEEAMANEFGLEDLLKATAPTEEQQAQKANEVEAVLAEFRATTETTTTTTRPSVVTTTTTTTNNNSAKQPRSKYSQADNLLDF